MNLRRFVLVAVCLTLVAAACTSSEDSDASDRPSSDQFFQTDAEDLELLATVNDETIIKRDLVFAVSASRASSGLTGEVTLGTQEVASAMSSLIGLAALRGPASAIGVDIPKTLTGNPNVEQDEMQALLVDLGNALLAVDGPEDVDRVVNARLDTLDRSELIVCTRHILVDTEAEAVTVLSRLDAGEDFEIIAALMSVDESGPFGGYLGCGASLGFIPTFAAAVDALDIGEVSPIIETEFGFHIIRRDELEQGAIDQLMGTIRNEALSPWLEQQFTAAVVDLDDRIGEWDGRNIIPPDDAN